MVLEADKVTSTPASSFSDNGHSDSHQDHQSPLQKLTSEVPLGRQLSGPLLLFQLHTSITLTSGCREKVLAFYVTGTFDTGDYMLTGLGDD